jgi:TetR/AcrR family fatty acid metabolism transcriptional regulator
MQELLSQINGDGQAAGEILDDMAPDRITEFMFVAARGVVYDWCIHEGSYNLESKMVEYMNRVTTVFLSR